MKRVILSVLVCSVFAGCFVETPNSRRTTVIVDHDHDHDRDHDRDHGKDKGHDKDRDHDNGNHGHR